MSFLPTLLFLNATVASDSPGTTEAVPCCLRLSPSHALVLCVPVGQVTLRLLFPQVMKTYHMYHAESISAESKLKEAEKQEEKQFNKSGDISVNLLRHEDRPQRRSSVKKIEKMKEKVGKREGWGSQAGSGLLAGRRAWV